MTRMRVLDNATRQTFIMFFGSHIIFSLLIDLQVLIPTEYIPKPLNGLLLYEIDLLKDPLMGNARSWLWFQGIIYIELLFQVPFFMIAIYMLNKYNNNNHKNTNAIDTTTTAAMKASSSSSVLKQQYYYPDWFRTLCIIYGAHTSTTMIPILTTLAFFDEEHDDNTDSIANIKRTFHDRCIVFLVYLPYLLFPSWILYLAARTTCDDVKALTTNVKEGKGSHKTL